MICRTIPPAPPEFVSVFATGGWQLVELLYGGRTDLHRKWVAMTGAVCRRPRNAPWNAVERGLECEKAIVAPSAVNVDYHALR